VIAVRRQPDHERHRDHDTGQELETGALLHSALSLVAAPTRAAAADNAPKRALFAGKRPHCAVCPRSATPHHTLPHGFVALIV
jgi:hypothetical protein